MSRAKSAPATVTLTRTNVENILVYVMGWEHEDVTVFWRYARLDGRKPGCLERTLRRDFEKAFRPMKRELDGAS
jgi:hypothetical protein